MPAAHRFGSWQNAPTTLAQDPGKGPNSAQPNDDQRRQDIAPPVLWAM
jgi:hypothetical protein